MARRIEFPNILMKHHRELSTITNYLYFLEDFRFTGVIDCDINPKVENCTIAESLFPGSNALFLQAYIT
jgi:hypothetical protein